MYRIGGKQERYRILCDTLTDAFATPFLLRLIRTYSAARQLWSW